MATASTLWTCGQPWAPSTPRCGSGLCSKSRSLFLGENPGTLAARLASSLGIADPPRLVGRGANRLMVAAAKDKDQEAPQKKKMPSAVKRALLSEKRRVYNKARKSEIRTRMKKVFTAIEELRKKGDGVEKQELAPVELLIGEAYSVIDKAVKVRTLHRNTGRRRKSRLGRAKRDLEIALGWYTPPPPPSAVASPAPA